MLGHSREVQRVCTVHACKMHSTNKPACLPATFYSLSFHFANAVFRLVHSHLVCFVHKLIYELLAHSYSCFIFFVCGTFANGVHIFCLAKPFRLVLAHKQIRCGFNRFIFYRHFDWTRRECAVAHGLRVFFLFFFFWDYRFSLSHFLCSFFNSANVITKSLLKKTNSDYKNTHQQHLYLFGCSAHCTQSSAEEIWIKKTY